MESVKEWVDLSARNNYSSVGIWFFVPQKLLTRSRNRKIVNYYVFSVALKASRAILYINRI